MAAFVPNNRINNVLFAGPSGLSPVESKTIDKEITTIPMRPGRWGGMSIQMYWTGTPNGLIRVEYSNDSETWSIVSGTTVTVNSPGDTMWILPDAIVGYVCIRYLFTSGTGTLTGKAVCREGGS